MRCRERRPRRSVDILELDAPKYRKYGTKEIEINIFFAERWSQALRTRLPLLSLSENSSDFPKNFSLRTCI